MLLGVGATAVAGVAVALSFAVSNASTITDVVGEPLSVSAIVVPAPSVTPTPRAATPTPKPAATPEVVPAPQPRDVAPDPEPQPEPEPSAPAVEAPAEPAPPAPEPTPTQEEIESVVRQYAENRDWDGLRDWVAQQGWSPEELQAIIDELRQKYPGFARAETSASADSASVGDLPGSRVGSKRDQSLHAPEGG